MAALTAALASAQDSRPYIVSFSPTLLDGLPLGDAKVDNRDGRVRELIRAAPDESVVLRRHFSRLLNGFAGNLTTAGRLYFITQGAAVEEDTGAVKQAPESWGLDRIDQTDLPLDGATYGGRGTGDGAHVFIVDTGINSGHDAFAGRLGNGVDFVDNDDDPEDCDGHGTHCAGTAAGAQFGVADLATVHGVRVLNCDGVGSFGDLIEALEWIAEHPSSRKVASLSLAGSRSDAVNSAVQGLVDAGVVVVAAAGNNGGDACNYSPASASAAITVGATRIDDEAAAYTNAGSCVDILAPGTAITSAWVGGSSARETISGTSMAAPHVAGVAAQTFTRLGSGASPSSVRSAILSDAVSGTITDSSDSEAAPNRNNPNLFVQHDGAAPSGPAPAPVPPSPPSAPPSPAGSVATVTIDADAYPSDISWTIYDMSDDAPAELVSGAFANGALPLASRTWDVPLPREVADFRFTIFDAQGDGLCCRYGLGRWEVRVDGVQVGEGRVFTDTDGVDFRAAQPSTPPAPPSIPPSSPAPPPPLPPGGLADLLPGLDLAGAIAVIVGGAVLCALGACAAVCLCRRRAAQQSGAQGRSEQGRSAGATWKPGRQ